MYKYIFLNNVILLVFPLLFFCQTCHEGRNEKDIFSICDTEKNRIQEWIKKVSSKEHLNEDFQLAAPHRCQGDIRSCPQLGLVTHESEDWTIGTSRDSASGLLSGPAWLLYSHGEGAIYTELGEDTGDTSLSLALFTGESVTWLYPDLVTGLSGHFVAGTMLSASEAEVSSVSITDFGVPKLTIRKNKVSDKYKFDPSTDVHLSSDPLVRDPYEKELLDVTESGVPGAGMGVFSRRALDNNTIVGYFNGVHRDRAEVLSSEGKKSVYLVERTWEGEMLDIPEEFTAWSSYRASAGHLINHSTDSNVDYTECRHPRFGHILCVVTTRKIGAGKELFVKVREAH